MSSYYLCCFALSFAYVTGQPPPPSGDIGNFQQEGPDFQEGPNPVGRPGNADQGFPPPQDIFPEPPPPPPPNQQPPESRRYKKCHEQEANEVFRFNRRAHGCFMMLRGYMEVKGIFPEPPSIPFTGQGGFAQPQRTRPVGRQGPIVQDLNSPINGRSRPQPLAVSSGAQGSVNRGGAVPQNRGGTVPVFGQRFVPPNAPRVSRQTRPQPPVGATGGFSAVPPANSFQDFRTQMMEAEKQACPVVSDVVESDANCCDMVCYCNELAAGDAEQDQTAICGGRIQFQRANPQFPPQPLPIG